MSLDLTFAETRRITWRSRVLRFVLLGPLIGVLVSILHTTVAIVVWVQHSEPDFYFRGWAGVKMTLQLDVVSGSLSGIPLGGVLALFEWLAGRRIRITILAVCACIVALVASIIIVPIEFERHKLLGPSWSPPAIAMWTGVILGPLLSRKGSHLPDLH